MVFDDIELRDVDEIIELWQCIRAPTLLINATNGLQNRTGQDDTLQYFKDAELHDVAGAGHWIHHDQLEQVATLMEDFLRRA